MESGHLVLGPDHQAVSQKTEVFDPLEDGNDQKYVQNRTSQHDEKQRIFIYQHRGSGHWDNLLYFYLSLDPE